MVDWAISVTRPEVGAFSLAEIELLQTFADQAVIAIRNVRLFKELETARGRRLVFSDGEGSARSADASRARG